MRRTPTIRLLSRIVVVLAPLLLSILVAGCGGPIESLPTPCPEASQSFGCVDGATLALMPGVEFPASPIGLVPRVARALELAGDVWGVDPADHLTGWTIEFSGGWFPCLAAGGAVWTYGCTYTSSRLIRAAAGLENCLPGVLIHEFGHVLIGDGEHEDPRFELANALEGAACE